MTRDQLQIVLNMASYELDGKAADVDMDYPECQEAFDAVKQFWAGMTVRGVDTLKLNPEVGNRN